MDSKGNKKKTDKDLQKLCLSIGSFIHYWGFRRIHGAIWAQLYLSKTPMNCTDLTQKLNFSKALISPALEELCRYQLIEEVPSTNQKNKYYQAKENLSDVIQHVLKTREKKMLQQIEQDFNNFKKNKKAIQSYDQKRLKSIQDMVFAAQLMLDIMLSQDDLFRFPVELEKLESI